MIGIKVLVKIHAAKSISGGSNPRRKLVLIGAIYDVETGLVKFMRMK
jgi:hypothetical protein